MCLKSVEASTLICILISCTLQEFTTKEVLKIIFRHCLCYDTGHSFLLFLHLNIFVLLNQVHISDCFFFLILKLLLKNLDFFWRTCMTNINNKLWILSVYMYLGIPIVCLMPIIAYQDHRSISRSKHNSTNST